MKPNPSIRATARWAQAIDGLPMIPMARRPVAGMWSSAEYTDCVRETTFGMRFLLDIAISGGDVDLGECSCRFAASDESRKDVGKGDRSACCSCPTVVRQLVPRGTDFSTTRRSLDFKELSGDGRIE